ncbi:DUF4278 domain-containing protein [Prochlorococcus sp. MIT 1307]|uniref:DUF4278 domain-containing protein n=1 Tax=Prochlorococcus sp. MIT 1307 TaxID=3096219 RepID=UPI002A755752|nr:DUF4278 domain-containing protein [Prochlorococcus sp. MIT 1307]
MSTLLYRGHDYVQHKEPLTNKQCVELTYRRKHYNTCRNEAQRELHPTLSYRGVHYTK